MLKVSRPKTLKENALESLRNAITTEVFKPGERLVERSLCETMGVSRTVVRECIRHLESERLVVGVANAGYAVASISEDEIKEIYEIRTLLECAAVYACAEKADATVVKRLRELRKEIAQYLKKEQVLDALETTTEFYQLIFTTGGKHVAWDLVAWLNARISRLRALTLSTAERRHKGPENLNLMIDAIENNDPELAREICIRHLTEAAEVAYQLN